ncbi:MAG: RNase adapter RapZ [Elusimicrobiaceae bacterium]|nr:RNase adapter RapZ [Elusimicrobiaceae bacterium]
MAAKKLPIIKKSIFIISGLSGAGRSQALKCFEDLGFYCVDNLPVDLLRSFLRLTASDEKFGDIALGLDIREGRKTRNIPLVVKALRDEGYSLKVLFLEASDSVLVTRFSETRHRHPLGENITESIKRERRLMLELKELADKVIDTGPLTLGELKEKISSVLELKTSGEMKLTLLSFGFKYGLPLDADIVMDVRFMPNPYYVPRLRHKTGLDKPIADYILRDKSAAVFMRAYIRIIRQLVPLYMKEGKSYLTIAIGCTGGKHRSVLTAHRLAVALKESGHNVVEFHRDIKK